MLPMAGEDWVLYRITIWITLLLSLTVHEWAHAWSAWKLGDNTANSMGRLTLNPFAHIDPIGTVLLPLLGVPFGWAKPVPVNPLMFRGVGPRKGMMITAAAGPLANLCLAAICTALFALVVAAQLNLGEWREKIVALIHLAVFLNVILATFNMLPIPPLDGSRIADWLMPRELRGAWESFCRLGPLALVGVIFLSMAGGFSVIMIPVGLAALVLEVIELALGG